MFDLNKIAEMLPNGYKILASIDMKEIECISMYGFKYHGEKNWDKFTEKLKEYVGSDFIELLNITPSYHTHFIIYLK